MRGRTLRGVRRDPPRPRPRVPAAPSALGARGSAEAAASAAGGPRQGPDRESWAAPALVLHGNRPRRRLAQGSSSPPQSHKPRSKELKEKRNQPPDQKIMSPYPLRNPTDCMTRMRSPKLPVLSCLKFTLGFMAATRCIR